MSETPRTIGSGWAHDPVIRERQVVAQVAVVNEICDIEDELHEWELEAFALERQRERQREEER